MMPVARSTRASSPSPSSPLSAPRLSGRPSLPPITTATESLATGASIPASPRLIDDPVSARSAAVTSPNTAAASSSVAGGGSARDEIEMEPIVTGHRRRKSSLMSPVGQPHSANRPRSQSLLGGQHQNPSVGGSSLAEETKISEEGSYVISPAGSRHEHESDSYSDDDVRDDEETGLNKKEKKRRQRKKRRNTLLDQRIARDKSVPRDAQPGASESIAKRIGINVGLILSWYLFSLSISLYNKWMFDEDRLNFAFPLFTTSMHMIVQFILSGLVLYFIPSLRPQVPHESDGGRSRHESEPGTSSPAVSKWFYLTRVGPCGAATGLDIGLGNTSLKVISLTFYTMCKSSSLAFVLLFAFLFRLETPTWRLVAIIATMTIGVVLMVFGEVEFKLGGFVLVISAAFFSGLRWASTQILLLRHPATSNPFSSIFLLTPVMFFTLLALAFPVEGFWPLCQGLGVLSDEFGAFMTPLFLFFPGILAFLMTSSEFALLQRTSVVTLSIAGIFKEVVTIMAASFIFDDTLTPINFVGLITTMLAIVAYNYVKIVKMREEAQADPHGKYQRADGSQPSSGAVTDVDDEDDEAAGLLRPSNDLGNDAIFTSDGDLQPNLANYSRGEENKEAALERHHD